MSDRPARRHAGGTICCNQPWTAAELSRLIVAARTLPDAPDTRDHRSVCEAECWRVHAGLGDVPARDWWPAFVLVLVDTK
ncbi:MAG TPA: hypothetical protein VML55_00350, partial [Planctomycetaceae bacterium]|nr:hypothetical protein [Planctomycetaceae bacterium]